MNQEWIEVEAVEWKESGQYGYKLFARPKAKPIPERKTLAEKIAPGVRFGFSLGLKSVNPNKTYSEYIQDIAIADRLEKFDEAARKYTTAGNHSIDTHATILYFRQAISEP